VRKGAGIYTDAFANALRGTCAARSLGTISLGRSSPDSLDHLLRCAVHSSLNKSGSSGTHLKLGINAFA
jgi:hypothetical protein